MRTTSLPRKRGAHSSDCPRAPCNCKPNPLDPEDFARMHLPKSLWGATLEDVTASARDAIQNYAAKIVSAYDNGVGLYVFGPKGSGKTGAATVALKEARAWGFTAYCASVSQLRDAIREHTAFDSETSVWSRARTVDFLLLDDVRTQDADERLLTISDLRNLIVGRYDNGLPTLITSTATPLEWGTAATQIQDALEKCCAILQVTGKNRHSIGPQDKMAFLGKR